MTGRYRTWSVAKWDRDPFRSLSPLQRYLYLTLHLGPFSTALPGVSVCGPAALSEAAGDVPGFQDHLAAMQAADVLLHEGRLFVLPDVIAEAAPSNPNQAKAWKSAFDELPAGELKQQIDSTTRQVLIAYGQAHPVTFKDGRAPDPFAYIRAWDPTWNPASVNVTPTLTEHPSNLPRTSVDGPRDVPGTSAGGSSDVPRTSVGGSENVTPRLAEPEAVAEVEREKEKSGGRKGWGAGEGKPAKHLGTFTSLRSLAETLPPMKRGVQ